jgi:hypothetical protein
LGAAHVTAGGFQSLIVGDEAAAQLAGDYSKASARPSRAQQRREPENKRQRKQQSDDDAR